MGQVLVLGLIAGGIYALFAVGIVLVFRGTGVLSFAQGEIGTASLYVAAVLATDAHLPYVVAAVAAVSFAVLLSLAFEVLFVRRMISNDPVSTAVCTIGLVLFLVAGQFLLFGANPKPLPNPYGGFEVAGVIVYANQLLAIALALALGFGLQAALRRTDFGLGILAAAQDPAAVRLVGVPLSRISLVVWGIGGALSGIAALLVEPTVGLFAPGFASEFFIFGLGAAVIGGLTSLPGAVAGGLGLGIAENLANRYLVDLGIPSIRYVVLLVVVLVALLGRIYLPQLRVRLAGPVGTAAVTA